MRRIITVLLRARRHRRELGILRVQSSWPLRIPPTRHTNNRLGGRSGLAYPTCWLLWNERDWCHGEDGRDERKLAGKTLLLKRKVASEELASRRRFWDVRGSARDLRWRREATARLLGRLSGCAVMMRRGRCHYQCRGGRCRGRKGEGIKRGGPLARRDMIAVRVDANRKG